MVMEFPSYDETPNSFVLDSILLIMFLMSLISITSFYLIASVFVLLGMLCHW